VLGTRVVDFAVTAALEGGQQQLDARGGAMHRDVRALLAHLPAQGPRLPDWRSGAALGASPPHEQRPSSLAGAASDPRFYGSPEARAEVYRSLAPYFGAQPSRRLPSFTARPIASSNTLVRNNELLARWRDASRPIAAVEMELAGVFEAVQNQD